MKTPALVLVIACGGCAGRAEAPPPEAAEAGPDPAPAVASPPAATTRPAPPAATPEEIARARGLVDKGVKLYREGQYAQAEDVLKQGITLYPFMADANLVLAKILLIRASASRDMTLYNNARLMLEMARALDPGSREVEQLLELVRQPTAE